EVAAPIARTCPIEAVADVQTGVAQHVRGERRRRPVHPANDEWRAQEPSDSVVWRSGIGRYHDGRILDGQGSSTKVRIVALIAAYNEARFIGGCLDHLHEQGVETYLCDNGSTD